MRRDELETLAEGVEDQLARSTDDPDLAASSIAPRIGRFSILRRIGAGAMGVVFAGFDEQLDRKVAIKLLHHHTGDAARQRLVREAQGLARLSHPNVVQIYEVGEHEDAPFLAMELVDGQTLSRWAAPGRPWPEVVRVLREAGLGLAAAHRKGLVHRDFKPDNVMIDGEGRVRVMDFGLVHGAQGATPTTRDEAAPATREDRRSSGPSSVSDAATRSSSALSEGLTKTGSMLGTPAYMAPEQYAGQPTDARSDQFSFCVAAWELLYGQRPFAGRTVAQLFIAIANGDLDEPPREREVPAWLRKVITRGLAAKPDQRWPSMDALLAALSASPTRRRRWWLAGAALALAPAGLVAAIAGQRALAERERAAQLATCEAEAGAIATSWNPTREAELAAVFDATDLYFAPDHWARTRAALDAYADEWTALRASTCAEARVEGSRSGAQADAIAACLDDARAAFDVTLEVLATADAGLVAHAGALPSELPELRACVNERRLAERQTPPEALRDRLAGARRELERVRALHRSARYEPALALAEQVATQADAIGWPAFTAEARLAVGEQQHRLARFEDAAASFEAALALASEARDDALALRCITKLARVVGYDLARYDLGLTWARVGAMYVTRLGATDTVADALLINERATITSESGVHDAVAADYERALTILERELGPNHPHVAVVLHNLGGERYALSEFDAAGHDVERSLRIRERVYGPNHPIVADSLATLGTIREEQGQYAVARPLHQRALDIRQLALGPEHPRVASSLLSIGLLDLYAVDFAVARASFERALAIQEQVSGPDHPRIAEILDYLAGVDARNGELESAVGLLERALAIREAHYGREHAMYAHSLANLSELRAMLGQLEPAREGLEQALAISISIAGPEGLSVASVERRLGAVLAELGRLDEALAHQQRAATIFEDSLGPDHLDVGAAQFDLGRTLLELGRADEAVVALRRAIDIEARVSQGAGNRGDSSFTFALALWRAGEREQAVDWARKAASRHADEGNAERGAEIEAWLREHDG